MTVKPWENSSIIAECDAPEPEDIRYALDNRQVLWRFKNNHVQVLAQTLSNYLDTRTSSLLAVNKKQGVPAKHIHREWKRTWVDLEGLKKRVEQTGHSSELLKGLKLVIQCIDAVTTPDDHAILSSVEQKKQAKPGTKHNPIDVCDVAVEANERAVHNTERINVLATEVRNHEKRAEQYISDLPRDLDPKNINRMRVRLARLEGIMYDGIGPEGIDPDFLMKNQLDSIRGRLDRVDKQATQAAVDQTLLGDLNTRLGRLATQADRLDTKTDGLVSRMSVLEDTSRWLSWTLAGVIGVRFLSVMLRMLKRK